MSKRYDAGTPLAAAITAKDWNECLDTRDRVLNAAKGVRDLFSGEPRLTALCEVDQADPIDVGDIVELRNSTFTIDAGDLTDQLLQEVIMSCRHFAASDRNPLLASFGVATQPGTQGDLIEIAISGAVVARVNGSGAWAYLSKTNPNRLEAAASGFARVRQSLDATFSIVQLGLSQPFFRFINSDTYPIQDAEGAAVTTADAFDPSPFVDPHSIIAQMLEDGKGSCVWIRDERLLVLQGDC